MNTRSKTCSPALPSAQRAFTINRNRRSPSVGITVHNQRNTHNLNKAEKDRVINQLKAAQGNTFIQRDSPIYLSLYLQADQTVRAIESKVSEIKTRLDSIQAELGETEKYAERLAGGNVIAPISGVVWRINASDGLIGKGEPIIEIAEAPEHQFIEAQFPEAHAKSLYPGAKAVIKFSGLPPFTGTIRFIRQPSPTDLDNSSAIHIPRRLNQLKVYIDIDAAIDSANLVGQQCRVLIANRDTSLFSRPFEWVSVKVFLLLERWS